MNSARCESYAFVNVTALKLQRKKSARWASHAIKNNRMILQCAGHMQCKNKQKSFWKMEVKFDSKQQSKIFRKIKSHVILKTGKVVIRKESAWYNVKAAITSFRNVPIICNAKTAGYGLCKVETSYYVKTGYHKVLATLNAKITKRSISQGVLLIQYKNSRSSRRR